MSPSECISQWFQIYRRNEEPADILFVIETSAGRELIKFPHEDADGAGALFALAAQFGWKLQTPPVSARKISSLKYIINCFKFFYWTRPRNNIWPFEINKCASSDTLFTAVTLSEVQTASLREICKKNGVSINTQLFYALNRALEKTFSVSSPRAWWMPVNMRADLGLDTNDSSLQRNYVSNFTIDAETEMTARDYQRRISNCLRQQQHWATWFWQQLGRFIPEALVEKMAMASLSGTSYAGTFSNLGEWTCSDKNSNLQIMINPIQSHPIGAGAVIWNHRLSVSLRIYKNFPLDQAGLEKLLQLWTILISS